MLLDIERRLTEVGFDEMTTDEKNTLIALIGKRENKPYFEIDTPFILDYHKNLKIEAFSEISDLEIIEGFKSTNGSVYRMNRDDQMNMVGKALQLIFDPTITEVAWKTEDKGYVTHTADEWKTNVFTEALTHKEVTLHKYNVLKMQILAAVDHASLVDIKWEEVETV